MSIYQVTLPYMCAGIILKDGVVIESADILKWTKGKSLDEVAAWVRKKKGTIRRI